MNNTQHLPNSMSLALSLENAARTSQPIADLVNTAANILAEQGLPTSGEVCIAVANAFLAIANISTWVNICSFHEQTPLAAVNLSNSSSASSASSLMQRSQSSASAFLSHHTYLRVPPVTTATILTTPVTTTASQGLSIVANSSSSSSSSNSVQSQQSASTVADFERGLENWCNEKLGTEEHAKRIVAAQKIKKCYTTKRYVLNLIGLGLTSIPKEIGGLQHLQDLILGHNQLTSIPWEAIGSLHNLQMLFLGNNQLASIPEEIGSLHKLKWLYLHNNLLTSIPEEIGSLQGLDLSFTSLTSLPIEIFDLPSTCTVDITGCPFSSTVLDRIRERTSSSDYNGPRISHSINDRVTTTSERSLEELLPELYKIISKPQPTFSALLQSSSNAASLATWLGRLAYIADFQKGGEKTIKFALKVAEYLELAENDPAFRERFFSIIENTATTCGDKMAFSVIHLGVAKRLAQVSLDNLPELSYLLIHGVWALDELEKIARKKIETLHFFDELEVYLAYPIKLRERLNLPLDVEEMLYWGCSGLSQTDIENAYNAVSAKIQSVQNQAEFLVSQPIWRKALEKKAPEDYARCESVQQLVELTKSLLGG